MTPETVIECAKRVGWDVANEGKTIWAYDIPFKPDSLVLHQLLMLAVCKEKRWGIIQETDGELWHIVDCQDNRLIQNEDGYVRVEWEKLPSAVIEAYMKEVE